METILNIENYFVKVKLFFNCEKEFNIFFEEMKAIISIQLKMHLLNLIEDGYKYGEMCEIIYDASTEEEYEVAGLWALKNRKKHTKN